MLKKCIDFFLFSSFFIAICAVLMSFQAISLFSLSLPVFDFLSFVFFSTACSYNFHWYLSRHSNSDNERIQWTKKHAGFQLTAMILSGICVLYYAFQLFDYWFWSMIAVILTFLYSAPKLPFPVFHKLRSIAVGKTIFLSFVWTYVTTMLPMLISDKVTGQQEIFYTVQRFFLVYAICILFDYRDRKEDKEAGIRTLITNLPEKGIDKLFYGSIMTFAVFSMLLYWENTSVLVALILFIPGIITFFLFPFAKKNHSDYFYYGVLDGLMMLSAIFTSLLRIQ